MLYLIHVQLDNVRYNMMFHSLLLACAIFHTDSCESLIMSLAEYSGTPINTFTNILLLLFPITCSAVRIVKPVIIILKNYIDDIKVIQQVPDLPDWRLRP